jgi:uncharacterized SAM-binding protein YcdF (DUF218 family)
VAALAGVAIVFVASNTIAIARYAKRYDDTRSDVAIVLGAGTSNGKVSDVFAERIRHGVTLYEQGSVAHVIFTGGFGEGQTISDSEAAKNFAIREGLPPDSASIEERSTVTYENLEEAHGLMQTNGWETALVVSDPLHMKRSMLIAKRLGIDARPSPTPTTMYRSWRTKLKLLMYESFFYNTRLVVGRFYT